MEQDAKEGNIGCQETYLQHEFVVLCACLKFKYLPSCDCLAFGNPTVVTLTLVAAMLPVVSCCLLNVGRKHFKQIHWRALGKGATGFHIQDYLDMGNAVDHIKVGTTDIYIYIYIYI